MLASFFPERHPARFSFAVRHAGRKAGTEHRPGVPDGKSARGALAARYLIASIVYSPSLGGATKRSQHVTLEWPRTFILTHSLGFLMGKTHDPDTHYLVGKK